MDNSISGLQQIIGLIVTVITAFGAWLAYKRATKAEEKSHQAEVQSAETAVKTAHLEEFKEITKGYAGVAAAIKSDNTELRKEINGIRDIMNNNRKLLDECLEERGKFKGQLADIRADLEIEQAHYKALQAQFNSVKTFSEGQIEGRRQERAERAEDQITSAKVKGKLDGTIEGEVKPEK